ncbi:MAG: hypothetical protein Q7K41_06215 [Dehalococcoidales bacterium]|nr:hypothetical protein [Dehalococcoidales bacterium]
MPKVLRNAVRSTIAGLLVLDVVGATATELTDKEPFFNLEYTAIVEPEPLQQAGYNMLHPFGWIKNLQNANEVPSTFDSKAAKQPIGENNIKRITKEEAEKQDLLTPKITVDPAAKTITISTLFTTSPANEPILSTTLDKTYHAPGEISLRPDDPRNSFGSEHFEVPANFPIILPKGMHYALVTGVPGHNEPNPSQIIGFFYDPQANATFLINYYNEKQLPFNPDPKSVNWETYKKVGNPMGKICRSAMA